MTSSRRWAISSELRAARSRTGSPWTPAPGASFWTVTRTSRSGRAGSESISPSMSAPRSTTPRLKVAPPASRTLSSLISAIRPESLAVDFSISSSILRWGSVSGPVRPDISMRRYPAMTVTGVRNSCAPSDSRGSFSGSRRRRFSHPRILQGNKSVLARVFPCKRSRDRCSARAVPQWTHTSGGRMLIRRTGDIRSSEITDEQIYLRRREFMRLAGAAAITGAVGALTGACGERRRRQARRRRRCGRRPVAARQHQAEAWSRPTRS